MNLYELGRTCMNLYELCRTMLDYLELVWTMSNLYECRSMFVVIVFNYALYSSVTRVHVLLLFVKLQARTPK